MFVYISKYITKCIIKNLSTKILNNQKNKNLNFIPRKN